MLASGQTASYIANALRISESIIYRWKSRSQDHQKDNTQDSEFSVENQQLKERVHHLKTEREKKKGRWTAPLSIFSRATYDALTT